VDASISASELLSAIREGRSPLVIDVRRKPAFRAATDMIAGALWRGLAAVIAEVRKTHAGTVFSITPAIRNHRPVAVVLLANKGKVTTVTQPL
jgi:hypothetical protein